MSSHDTVSKFAYVGIFTYMSKCVYVNGDLRADKMPHHAHSIWVFAVCLSTHLGGTSLQRVNMFSYFLVFFLQMFCVVPVMFHRNCLQ